MVQVTLFTLSAAQNFFQCFSENSKMFLPVYNRQIQALHRP